MRKCILDAKKGMRRLIIIHISLRKSKIFLYDNIDVVFNPYEVRIYVCSTQMTSYASFRASQHFDMTLAEEIDGPDACNISRGDLAHLLCMFLNFPPVLYIMVVLMKINGWLTGGHQQSDRNFSYVEVEPERDQLYGPPGALFRSRSSLKNQSSISHRLVDEGKKNITFKSKLFQ